MSTQSMSAQISESALAGLSMVPQIAKPEPEVRTAMRVRKRNGSYARSRKGWSMNVVITDWAAVRTAREFLERHFSPRV